MPRESLQVLLVEDNDDDVLMIREGIDESGVACVVHVARHGEEALEWLRSQARGAQRVGAALILLDLNMPRMDGFELLTALKADPRLRHLPVVVLTTSYRDEDVVRAYAAGACSYVVKPVGLDALTRVISLLTAYWTSVARLPERAAVG